MEHAMLRYLAFVRTVLAGLLLVSTAAAVETLTITADQAIVRAKPGITHPVLTVVPQGAIFPVLETQEAWYKILLEDGREGWVTRAVGQVEQEERTLNVVAPPPVSVAQNRWALVIGNSAYGADIGPLPNPVNDATDMAATLQPLGFQVTRILNATHQQMEEALAAFRRQLRPGGVGLFYFAGHGAQVEGTNYLIPIGANVEKAATTKAESVSAEQVLASMTAAGTALNILILDACRNNPFLSRWPVQVPPGLAPMQAARGSFIAYATAPGAVAADGGGRNGTYTKHLLRYLTTPDLLVEQMFKRVRMAVEEETGGIQTPWEASSLQGDFSFYPSAAARPGLALVQEPGGQEQTGTSGASVAAATPSGLHQPELAPTVIGKDGAEMVLVPAGEFVMGTAPDDIASLLRLHPKANGAILKDEIPKHRVFLEAFYIDKYEVTNARFQQFVQATGYKTQAENEGGGKIRTGMKTWAQVPDATWRAPQGQGSSIAGLEAHPAVQVSWHDATAYCTWAGKRLPTEAEWEKAARGTDGRLYPWGNEVDGTRVNFCDLNCPFEWKEAAVNDGYRSTAPVGSYEAGKSLYGAYDMAGNVWEWVADRYAANYYRRSPARNPRGPTSGTQVVLRGGSWLYAAPSFRTSERAGVPADRRNENIGLRCVQTP
jgi:formylglycine-generating enzyme required for sulfatase activity